MFSIDDKHRLKFRGRLVERILSRYNGGRFAETPRTTVMHFTYGASATSSANWFDDPDNKLKSSAHVVVGRDGSVIQCVDFDTVAHHAGTSFWKGKSGLNAWSFGIELANWGYLKKSANSWTSWTGQFISNPILARHRNGNPGGSTDEIGWEPYSAVQIGVAAQILRVLAEKYGNQEIIGHDDISVGRKWDPGPAFDMQQFRELAMEDASEDGAGLLLVFTPNDTLNLRQGPGINYDIDGELKDGALVQPLEYAGNWAMVNVLDESHNATKTGWINTRHTVAA